MSKLKKPAKLQVEPKEKTYDEKLLDVVENLNPAFNSGYRPDFPSADDYRYEDHFETKLEAVPLLEPVSELQPHLAEAPATGLGDKFSRFDSTGATTDQGWKPHCVCYSGAYIKQEQERRQHRRSYDWSRAEWYDRCKEIDAWPNEDGTGIKFAGAIALHRGVIGNDPRSKKDDPKGHFYKIGSYVRLSNMGQIIESIKNNGCVWFGITIDKAMYTPLKTNQGYVVDAPRPSDVVGGHAMCATGYWLSQGWIEIHQSWGNNWGDNGRAWYPMSHFERYSDWDAWTVKDSAGKY